MSFLFFETSPTTVPTFSLDKTLACHLYQIKTLSPGPDVLISPHPTHTHKHTHFSPFLFSLFLQHSLRTVPHWQGHSVGDKLSLVGKAHSSSFSTHLIKDCISTPKCEFSHLQRLWRVLTRRASIWCAGYWLWGRIAIPLLMMFSNSFEYLQLCAHMVTVLQLSP